MDEAYKIEVRAPGLDGSKIKIQVQDKVLTLSYEQDDSKSEDEKPAGKVIRQEFMEYTSFQRSIPLAKSIDRSKIKANYKKGILTIGIPFAEEHKPETISISLDD